VAESSPAIGAKQWWALRWKALRAFSLPVSVLPVLAATAAVVPFSHWNWPVLVAAALGAGLLHCAGNLLNDYFDFRSGVDHKLDDDANRPGRVLVKGQMQPPEVLAEAGACLAIAAALTAYLVWACGWQVLLFGAAAAVSLYVYTGPPFAMKYHAMGEGLIFLTFGPLLMLGAAFTQTHQLEMAAMLASIPVGLATTAILVGGSVRDRDEDSQAGITTLSKVIGHGCLRAVYVALVTLSVLSMAGLAAFGLLPGVLLAAPLLLALLAKPIACVVRNQRLADIDAQTARFETVVLAAMILACALR
jgi:1,4-dihydroxy-2-naphthoate polyprenyltransferase